MRTTVTLDKEVVEDLRDGLGIAETGVLIRKALLEMWQRLAADRLIALGGSDPDAWAAPRRRPPDFCNPDWLPYLMGKPKILVDSSFWIDHIAGKATPVSELLRLRRAATHPMVIGEIAMGSFSKRKAVIDQLQILPTVYTATNSEVMAFIEWNKLFSKGIGFIDAHLLAAVKMTDDALILARDERLRVQAEKLGLAYKPVWTSWSKTSLENRRKIWHRDTGVNAA